MATSSGKMIIRNELLRYTVLSKAHAVAIAEYSVSCDDGFSELIQCLLSKDVRLVQRAAWCVSWATQKSPHIINPYIGVLVDQLENPLIHNAVTRNILRILQNIEIPDVYHGRLLNLCFNFIQNRGTAIAVKAFSLQVLFNLSHDYPEIQNELKVIIEDNMAYESAAFRSKGKHILVKLK